MESYYIVLADTAHTTYSVVWSMMFAHLFFVLLSIFLVNCAPVSSVVIIIVNINCSMCTMSEHMRIWMPRTTLEVIANRLLWMVHDIYNFIHIVLCCPWRYRHTSSIICSYSLWIKKRQYVCKYLDDSFYGERIMQVNKLILMRSKWQESLWHIKFWKRVGGGREIRWFMKFFKVIFIF